MEEILGLVAKLPWWVGVVLAVISYLALHKWAGIAPPAPSGDVKQLPMQLPDTLLPMLASLGQYVLPLLCLVAAIASAAQRAKRRHLVDNAADRGGASAIANLSWQEFEMLVGEAFRRDGFGVSEKGGAQADGGVDLVLRKGRESFLVQCKHWRAMTVGVTVVRELYGVMAAQAATGGFVVTSGRFTGDAVAFAKGRNIELIEGATLAKMLASAANARTRESRARPAAPATELASTPVCPLCAAPMLQRIAKKGSRAGEAFWGCSRFPACRGIVSSR